MILPVPDSLVDVDEVLVKIRVLHPQPNDHGTVMETKMRSFSLGASLCCRAGLPRPALRERGNLVFGNDQYTFESNHLEHGAHPFACGKNTQFPSRALELRQATDPSAVNLDNLTVDNRALSGQFRQGLLELIEGKLLGIAGNQSALAAALDTRESGTRHASTQKCSRGDRTAFSLGGTAWDGRAAARFYVIACPVRSVGRQH